MNTWCDNGSGGRAFVYPGGWWFNSGSLDSWLHWSVHGQDVPEPLVPKMQLPLQKNLQIEANFRSVWTNEEVVKFLQINTWNKLSIHSPKNLFPMGPGSFRANPNIKQKIGRHSQLRTGNWVLPVNLIMRGIRRRENPLLGFELLTFIHETNIKAIFLLCFLRCFTQYDWSSANHMISLSPFLLQSFNGTDGRISSNSCSSWCTQLLIFPWQQWMKTCSNLPFFFLLIFWKFSLTCIKPWLLTLHDTWDTLPCPHDAFSVNQNCVKPTSVCYCVSDGIIVLKGLWFDFLRGID